MSRSSYFLRAVCAAWAVSYLPSASANINLANTAFIEQKYDVALREYQLAAKVGNLDAQFKLGNMYAQGLGVDADPIAAAAWFVVAAENGLQQAKPYAKVYLNEFNASEKQALIEQVASYMQTYGLANVNATYLPVFIEANRSKRVSIGDADLEILDVEEQQLNGLLSDDFTSVAAFGDNVVDDEFSDGTEFGFDLNKEKSALRSDNYFLIVDAWLNSDGSFRNLENKLNLGRTGYAFSRAQKLDSKPAMFDGNPIEFPVRLKLGKSQQLLSLLEMRKSYPKLAKGIRDYQKHAGSGKSEDLYAYATTLEYFDGVRREDNEVLNLLREAAEKGHPYAQFALGNLLYREQIDPEQGLQWIAKAASSGLAPAEYWLAKLTLTSPWHETNERLAAFWFARAAKQKHTAAIRELAKLHLFSSDSELANEQKAADYIERIKITDAANPETKYLQAWLQKRGGDKKRAINTMSSAINMANALGWDTALWQDQLESWKTRGVVFSEEVPSGV